MKEKDCAGKCQTGGKRILRNGLCTWDPCQRSLRPWGSGAGRSRTGTRMDSISRGRWGITRTETLACAGGSLLPIGCVRRACGRSTTGWDRLACPLTASEFACPTMMQRSHLKTSSAVDRCSSALLIFSASDCPDASAFPSSFCPRTLHGGYESKRRDALVWNQYSNECTKMAE